MKKGARAVGVALVAGMGVAAAVPGLVHCQLQGVCDPSQYYYDDYFAGPPSSAVHEPFPLGSSVYDSTHWESGPIDSTWLDFPGQRVVFLFPNGSLGPVGPFPGPYTNVLAYVSPDSNANALGNSWTEASGNLAEITVHQPDQYPDGGLVLDGGDLNWWVAIYNATCAHQFLRVVVERAAPDAGPVDAGVAPSIDAAPDAPSIDATLDATTLDTGTDAPPIADANEAAPPDAPSDAPAPAD